MVMTARTLRVQAELGELAHVRRFVRQVASDADAPAEICEDLVQAVDEAATNVITHGYEGSTGWIEVGAGVEGDNIVIELQDGAPAFDPTTRPEPDLSIPPMARTPGGMGVHLIREATDEMTHRPRPGGGNILTLVRSMRPGRKEEG
jgi:anti-sigma regulatory factor (Ser/Thr protein kinase)